MENPLENAVQEVSNPENEKQEASAEDPTSELHNHYNGNLLVALPERKRSWPMSNIRGQSVGRGRKRKSKGYDYEKMKQRIYKKTDCPYCDKTYSMITSAYNHIQQKHRGFPTKYDYEGGEISCTICEETCESVERLTEHVNTHPPGLTRLKKKKKVEKVKKKSCKDVRKEPSEYDGPGLRPKAMVDYDLSHLPKLYAKKAKLKLRYECSACHKKFKTASYVKHHTAKYCPLLNAEGSGESFTTVTVKQEPPDHEGVAKKKSKKPPAAASSSGKASVFQCSICTRMFKTYSLCQKHIASHRKYRQHSCPLCSRVFTTELLLVQHLSVEHPQQTVVKQEEPEEEEEEEDVLVIDEEFESEAETHHQRSYECLLCSRTFKRENDLKNHARTHTVQDQAAFMAGRHH